MTSPSTRPQIGVPGAGAGDFRTRAFRRSSRSTNALESGGEDPAAYTHRIGTGLASPEMWLSNGAR